MYLIGSEAATSRAVEYCGELLENYDAAAISLPAPLFEQAPVIAECVSGEADSDNALVMLCDTEPANLRALHAATGFLKARGLVINTLYRRTVFYGPPRATVNPVHNEVMFVEAGKIAGNLRRGHYLEFGVFDGRTFTLAWHAIASRCPWKRMYGFDSFTGILGAGADGVYVDGTYCSNRETFAHNWKVSGLDATRCTVVQGDFRTLLAEPGLRERLGIDAASVVHIDCDVYEAAKAALDFVAPVLMQGAVLLFDEFHANAASNATGERRALREMLEDHPYLEVERWHDYALEGRSFFVHRTDR